MAESFFDEGFGRKVAGLIGGWKEGNPVEIQKRPENPRWGKEYPSSQFTYEKVPCPVSRVRAPRLEGAASLPAYDIKAA